MEVVEKQDENPLVNALYVLGQGETLDLNCI